MKIQLNSKGKSMRYAKQGLIVALISLCSTVAYSQTEEWTKFQEKDGVALYYMFGTCEDKPIVFFKVENRTDTNKCFSISTHLNEADGTKEENLPVIMICADKQQIYTGDCSNINIPKGYIQKATISGEFNSPVFSATVIDMH